jgi:hypothetical protein
MTEPDARVDVEVRLRSGGSVTGTLFRPGTTGRMLSILNDTGQIMCVPSGNIAVLVVAGAHPDSVLAFTDLLSRDHE